VRHEFGRYSEPALLILVSLSASPKHGYAIREDVEQIANVRLGPGTLYGAISRLEHHGLIEALPVEERRRPYELTAAGSSYLRGELDALSTVVRTARGRLDAEVGPA
jgi:DNA-binding PadR family transcriptional regulator